MRSLSAFGGRRSGGLTTYGAVEDVCVIFGVVVGVRVLSVRVYFLVGRRCLGNEVVQFVGFKHYMTQGFSSSKRAPLAG